ncbi:MAG TPA: DNA methyltransferase [Nitrososphaerales archaeon]|nr:DNA methyltransferase [Nitrososphaerales archaeon]
MQLATREAYNRFLLRHNTVEIGNVELKLAKSWRIERFQPLEYAPQESTVWNFPARGSWATHIGNYPGNWSPFVPRNLLSKYSNVGDLVIDQMVGGGTTLVECKLLGRNAIGVDINFDACMLTLNRLDFEYRAPEIDCEPLIRIYQGDARNLNLIGNETADLVATHPPYASIINYSTISNSDDLSSLTLEDFRREMSKVALESFRILKHSKYCALLVGGTRSHNHYIPLHLGVLSAFLAVGFVLKEEVIKVQHATRSSREEWSRKYYDFLKIAHEHLYIFRKPAKNEDINKATNSSTGGGEYLSRQAVRSSLAIV